MVPVQVHVSINCLGPVIAIRIDNEAIIGVNVSSHPSIPLLWPRYEACSPRFISCMVAGAQSPGRVSPSIPAKMMLWVILWARWQCEVHQVGNRGAAFTATCRLHGRLVRSVMERYDEHV